MEISVIGTGYVGLVTGTCFAEMGREVVCIDIDENRIEKLSLGMVPFYEPGLEELVQRNLKNKRLKFTTDSALAIQHSKIIFIAVGNPTREDGVSDLKYVISAATVIAQAMNEPKTIVIKSTVPIGTFRQIEKIIREKTKYDFSIVSNPEFLKEGSAVSDFLKPERVVIGTQNEHAIQLMKELYDPFIRSGNPILVMDNASAEFSKYACNAYLAMRISFINEIANLAEAIPSDIESIRKVLMTDSRIGSKFLYPGIGYGGSCFGKDVRALIAMGHSRQTPLKILQAVEETNEKQKEILFQKTYRYFQGKLAGKTIAIWGLSFKPNTDDMRDAPSIAVIRKLLDHNVKIHVYDPIAIANAKSIFENRLDYYIDRYECLRGADLLLILTEWNEFRKPDFQKMKGLLAKSVIFDGRNLFSPKQMKEEGFVYEGVGLL